MEALASCSSPNGRGLSSLIGRSTPFDAHSVPDVPVERDRFLSSRSSRCSQHLHHWTNCRFDFSVARRNLFAMELLLSITVFLAFGAVFVFLNLMVGVFARPK